MTNTPTQLYLIRHGSTELNEAGILQGKSSVALSDRGKAQAQGIAVWLSERPVDVIYSSDMNRARQTAEIIQQRVDAPLHTTPHLRERDYGLYDGMALTEVSNARRQNGYPSVDPFHDWHGVDGVEDDATLYQRLMAFLQPILQTHTGQGIAVVTHSGVIQAFLYGTYRIPPDRLFAWRIERGGLFHFVVQHNFPEMRAYYPDATLFLT